MKKALIHSVNGQAETKVDVRLDFYEQTVKQLLPNLDASILVVAGGKNDRDVFYKLGFTNVTISNLDNRMNDSEFSPYRWCLQDAQKLTYDNDAFDYVVEHAGLHHCGSPHKALLEMYRVSRIGLIAMESRDSLIMNLLKKINFTPEYEWAGVFYWEKGEFGGVNNTIIPNYIYRWSENEVEKTINSFAPHAKHQIIYRYGCASPSSPKILNNYLKKLMITIINPIYKLFVIIFPRQQNLFAFHVKKPVFPDDLQPWLKVQDGEIIWDRAWVEKRVKGFHIS